MKTATTHQNSELLKKHLQKLLRTGQKSISTIIPGSPRPPEFKKKTKIQKKK